MQEENNYCVYKHTSPSGKVYIGITGQNPERRWRNGIGYYQNKHFTNAIKKYGWENFIHEILFTNLSKEDASEKESELIAFYKSNQREFGYNHTSGGEKGTVFSEESKEKNRQAHLNKHHTEKSKGKISKATKGKNNPFYGKHHSEETKRKISENRKGVTPRCAPWNKGCTLPEEMKQKISKNSIMPKIAAAYKEYKASGGTLKWRDFLKEYSKNNE